MKFREIYRFEFAYQLVTVSGSLIWLLVAAAVAGEAAAGDVQTRLHPHTDTAPVSKAQYWGGRFIATFVLNAGDFPAAVPLERAALYIPSTTMYNAAM